MATTGESSAEQRGWSQGAVGLAYGLAAYFWWAGAPLYFRLVGHIPSLEIVAWRVAWGLAFMALWLVWRGRLGEVRAAVRDRKTRTALLWSTGLIAVNWFVFIYAVVTERIILVSLGYFLNPLFSVLLAVVILRERLRPAQGVSVAIGLAAVAYLWWNVEGFPWIAVSLAVTFGMYGLIRKVAPVDSPVGLTVETALLTPILLPAALWWGWRDGVTPVSVQGWENVLLLAGAGPVTVLPMLWFTHAARRLRLVTVGFLQYIGPSGQFIIAVYFLHEPFSRELLITFVLIWAALAVFTVDAVLRQRAVRAQLRSGHSAV